MGLSIRNHASGPSASPAERLSETGRTWAAGHGHGGTGTTGDGVRSGGLCTCSAARSVSHQRDRSLAC
jgi:hypothetical protein